MNDARESTNRLDGRIDALTAEMHAGFKNVVEQTQAGFEDHRLYTEFLVTGLRNDMGARFNQVDRRFDSVAEQTERRFDAVTEQMDRRFDSVNEQFEAVDQRFDSVAKQMDRRFDSVNKQLESVDQRFDRLERLIKGEAP